MNDTNTNQLKLQLEDLIEHEEDLREINFREKMDNLRRKQRRTAAENRTLASLPGHIAFLEEEVERISLELGGDKFRHIPNSKGWDPTAMVLPIELVQGSKASRIVNKTNWEECSDTLESLYHGLFLDHARLIFRWDTYLVSLLHNTRQYSEASIAEDQVLEAQWKNMLHTTLNG
ncbi:uncharacterized protein MELLADRAFT_114500 [Melampsora larici-populina 98AG31]|uniref:Uncharacterized protein n=1 Tax=Melampsora larici-populina (strain 98AG31 / pathotype 3-4-7) TaxID=747676 RepID=F4SDQ4_MELLP|nr:uncharacterized protein MELLADRAFT_114500 [Melampsora larici-populina 98AG31]EGF97223.1 hypothetical protein MELLADRAFT_114500 [Melampsora larici-populina 98AG31]